MPRGHKIVVFVVAAMKNNKIISDVTEADSVEDAQKSFEAKHKIAPTMVSGPFYRKQTNQLNKNIQLKFGKERKQAVYNDWIVIANVLIHPPEMALIFFEEPLNGKNLQKPNSMVVRLSDLTPMNA